MSKYKSVMRNTGIMQKEVLSNIQRVDPRVDKPLLSKIVNDICLPNKATLESICRTLHCDVLDIYEEREIDLLQNKAVNIPVKAVATADIKQQIDVKQSRKKSNVYNLTVELDRSTALRVLSKESLNKLGYSGVTDFVRKAVEALIMRLEEIEKKGN